VFKIALGDGLLLGMAGQPLSTAPEELVYLIFSHPVVFVVVQNRNKDLQVPEQVL
jgi:hypothetical protein